METEYKICERRLKAIDLRKYIYIGNDNKINKQIKKEINEYISWVEETAVSLEESILVRSLLKPLLAMNANPQGTAKRGEKCHWQKLVPQEKVKLYGSRQTLFKSTEASPSSFSWMYFLGCLRLSSVLFIKTTYSREPWHCGVQREERIVHAFAWFRNWLHQNNAPCLISLFNKNTDVNVNSITGTPVFHQYSAWRKSWTYC